MRSPSCWKRIPSHSRCWSRERRGPLAHAELSREHCELAAVAIAAALGGAGRQLAAQVAAVTSRSVAARAAGAHRACGRPRRFSARAERACHARRRVARISLGDHVTLARRTAQAARPSSSYMRLDSTRESGSGPCPPWRGGGVSTLTTSAVRDPRGCTGRLHDGSSRGRSLRGDGGAGAGPRRRPLLRWRHRADGASSRGFATA
jgi:hypothetical protein